MIRFGRCQTRETEPGAVSIPAPNGRGLVRKAAAFVQSRLDSPPEAAVILGSGLGGLAARIEDPVAIPFADIPGFCRATADGHRGELVCGRFCGRSIVAMAGRFHRYEGHDNDAVMFPVSVLAAIGARRLIVSNAAGALNPAFRVGDLMVLREHLNWLPGASRMLLGAGFGPVDSIPSRSLEVYDAALRRSAVDAGQQHGFHVHQGTYLATLGPTYETRAEYRMMRRLGADAVGMSTIPEVLMGVAMKMRVFAVSMISNIADPHRPQKMSHREVLQAGRAAETKMELIVEAALCVES